MAKFDAYDALVTAWRLSDSEHFSSFFSLPKEHLEQIREYEWTCRLAYQQSHELSILGVKNELGLPLALVFTVPKNDINTSSNFGAGISTNWFSAVRKALCEVLQGIAVPDVDITDELPKTFIERPRFWKSPDRKPLLQKRLTAKNEQMPVDMFTEVHSLSNLDRSFMHQIFFADLTPPDVGLAGWHVVRAICEHFEPFSGSYEYEKPNIERVNKYLKSQKALTVNIINTDPFPYP